MNGAKITITLLTCFCIILTTAPSASADFVGVTTVIKDDAETTALCTEGGGQNVPGPLTVCNVFAVFDDPSDRLLAVAADLQVYNGENPDVFFQHQFNFTPTSPACAAIPAFPDLICDSFITIGYKCAPSPPASPDGTFPGPTWISDEFTVNGHVLGDWGHAAPDNGQGDAGTWPDLQVLVLQSSVAQGLSMSGMIDKIVWEDQATGELIVEANIRIECAAVGDPAAIPTVSEWGLIIMTLLALTAGTIVFARRRKTAMA